MNHLDDDAVARTLLNVRGRLCAAFYLLLRDAHAAEDVFQTVTVPRECHRLAAVRFGHTKILDEQLPFIGAWA